MQSVPQAGRRRLALVAAATGAGVVTVLATAAGAALTGAAAPLPLADPGALVRWGLPAVRALADLAAAVALGALALASVVLPVGPRRRAHPGALGLACAAAAVWAVAGLARLVLGYAAATGQGLAQPDLGTQLASYVTQVDSGRWASVAVAGAALVATVAAGATGLATARGLTALAGAAVAAEVLAAHAGLHGGGPVGAVAVGLHVAGVAVWVGGLATLLLLAGRLAEDLGPAAARWAPAAGWAFAVVAVSGVVAAWQQLGGPGGLASGYGGLVLAKTAALAAVGVLGALHRRRVLPSVAAGERDALVRAAAVELAVALLAIGLSGALASTEPPAPPAPTAQPTLAVAPGH